MHLRFTEQELSVLVQMLSLAAEVASWNQKPGSDEGVAEFEELESKILGKALQAGFSDIVGWDEEKQRYQLKPEFQQQAFYQECFEEFRNESFWEDLVLRMADRDLMRAIGKNAWEKLGEEARRERTKDIEKRYWEEFTRNGIERVNVIFPPGEG
ncbi:MAG: hypothetical protein MUF31_07930 [Akkermansiaceae bacterium]|nr:hypothetical protein [Akkermansiaceae bacterium]